MAKSRKKITAKKRSDTPAVEDTNHRDFKVVLTLIHTARNHAVASVNVALINLYWAVGEYISQQVAEQGWGEGTVKALADYVRRNQPNLRGFSSSNLWRMKQFFELYRDEPKLATLLRDLSWSHNLAVMSRCRRPEEREFYLRMSSQEGWSYRELQRQLAGSLFERTILSPAALSTAVVVSHPDARLHLRDSYLVEFLDLPSVHTERDLQLGLIAQLKQFLIELGRDFCFVGSEYPIQVGGRDFAIDLLFFNRALNCLVAIELKIDEFQPEHLGKLEFYLEALDRDVKKAHERPALGVLLCATKDREVVEYALSRSMSPALVAEYQTQLPNKNLLQRKLHEFYEMARDELLDNEKLRSVATTRRRIRKIDKL